MASGAPSLPSEHAESRRLAPGRPAIPWSSRLADLAHARSRARRSPCPGACAASHRSSFAALVAHARSRARSRVRFPSGAAAPGSRPTSGMIFETARPGGFRVGRWGTWLWNSWAAEDAQRLRRDVRDGGGVAIGTGFFTGAR